MLCEIIEKNTYVLISTPGFWHGSLGNPCNFLSHKWKKPVTIYTTSHILYDTCYHLYEVPRVGVSRERVVVMPGKSHGRRSLVGCSPWGHEESDTTEQLHFHFSFSGIGEGNGNSLHCSCLENPRDRGAWWAAVYGVAQSRTRLKRLSSSSRAMEWQIGGCSWWKQFLFEVWNVLQLIVMMITYIAFIYLDILKTIDLHSLNEQILW